jgi:uncharacterized protein YbcI
MTATSTQGQIEAAACEMVNQFLRNSVGRGATTISAVCHRDLMVVHLGGVLTTLEQSLAANTDEDSAPGLARSMRNHLVTKSRLELKAGLRRGLDHLLAIHDDPHGAFTQLVYRARGRA